MNRMRESPNLDALRSIAVGLVVLSHVRYFIGAGPWMLQALDVLGHMGVVIFFVHTTLVLMYSLERRPGAVPFYTRRVFRIWPLAIVAVLTMALLLSGGPSAISGAALVSNLLLIQNLTGHASTPAPLWSLPYEVQMYLFLPALFLFTRTVRRWATVYVVVLSMALLAWAFKVHGQLISFAPCFLPGVLAYILPRRNSSPLLLFAVVGAGAAIIPPLVIAGADQAMSFWVLCLVLGLIIPQCRELTSRSIAKAAKTVAKYSYGIYLTHMMAIGFTLSGLFPGPWFVQWTAFFVMLAGLSLMAYRFIEAPGIRLGAWLTRQETLTVTTSGTSTLTGGATGAATVKVVCEAARTAPPTA